MIAQPENEIYGAEGNTPCSDIVSMFHGMVWIVNECPSEPGVFWVLTSLGPIIWTLPLTKLITNLLVEGDQQIAGNLLVEGDQQIAGNLTVEGDQQIAGNLTVEGNCKLQKSLTLLPMDEPPAPELGLRIYVDNTYNDLRIKYPNGSVRIL